MHYATFEDKQIRLYIILITFSTQNCHIRKADVPSIGSDAIINSTPTVDRSRADM